MSTDITPAPCSATSFAVAAPIPDEAPVTMIVLPSSMNYLSELKTSRRLYHTLSLAIKHEVGSRPLPCDRRITSQKLFVTINIGGGSHCCVFPAYMTPFFSCYG